MGSRRRRRWPILLVTIGGLVAVLALGVVDRLTPHLLSLAVLYVLAVLTVTMLAGVWSGLVVAAASAVAWTVGDAASGELNDVGFSVLTGVLRFLALAIVAVLVHRLTVALEASRRSAERSREFLAVAAHQLRTPVAGVQLSADALLGTDATPAQEQLLATLSAESGRAGRLIASLLRVARLDQGESVRRDALDLRVIVADEAERARRRAVVDVLVDDTGHPVLIAGDADAVREALANLLDNARRHAAERVELALVMDHGWATVVVRDDGPGLPAGSEQRAFDRFVSLDGRGGAGLGLPIARDLVELMGGRLRYSQRSFRMSLPLARSHQTGRRMERVGAQVGGAGGPSE